jgi:hypothetical protein
MAKRAAKMARGGEVSGGKKVSNTRLLILFMMIGLIPFSIPTLALMFAGMLPTLVAALTDRSPARYAWICVGGLNFAGLSPALLRLWFGHHELSYAMHLITDFRTLLMSYAASGIGWLLYLGAPPVVMAVMVATSKRRAAALGAQMKKLEEEWGSEVVSRHATAASDQGPDL